jgi:hypothetical protein
VESRSHGFGLGGASDFSLKWEPKPGYSTVGENAVSPTAARRVYIRPVEVFSMVVFVVVCIAVLGAVLTMMLAVRFTLQSALDN